MGTEVGWDWHEPTLFKGTHGQTGGVWLSGKVGPFLVFQVKLDWDGLVTMGFLRKILIFPTWTCPIFQLDQTSQGKRVLPFFHLRWLHSRLAQVQLKPKTTPTWHAPMSTFSLHLLSSHHSSLGASFKTFSTLDLPSLSSRFLFNLTISFSSTKIFFFLPYHLFFKLGSDSNCSPSTF